MTGSHLPKSSSEALVAARKAIHDLCLERESTEGYREVFAQINAALRAEAEVTDEMVERGARGIQALYGDWPDADAREAARATITPAISTSSEEAKGDG